MRSSSVSAVESVTRTYRWRTADADQALDFVHVPGTQGTPYLFGGGHERPPIEIGDFHIGTTPVTQALWRHVMGSNPAAHVDLRCPVENVSWIHVTEPGGFLDRINASEVLEAAAGGDRALRFRLPSETEWEYAARGGPHWRDDLPFSGSNDPDEVAWYGPRWSTRHAMLTHVLGPRRGWRAANRLRVRLPTRTHPVATKRPNQLGIYDMSGNVWEWCQDVCTDDLDDIPRDGTPFLGAGDERRLRGGCHHNWDLHCRVWWRYGIAPDAHDGCIGFRLMLAPA